MICEKTQKIERKGLNNIFTLGAPYVCEQLKSYAHPHPTPPGKKRKKEKLMRDAVNWIQARRTAAMALFSLLLLSVAVCSASSARIAGFMTFGGSQYINMRHVLEELVSRGHEVGLQAVN